MFAPARMRRQKFNLGVRPQNSVLGPGPKTKFLYLTPAYSFISPGPPPCGCLSQHVKERASRMQNESSLSSFAEAKPFFEAQPQRAPSIKF